MPQCKVWRWCRPVRLEGFSVLLRRMGDAGVLATEGESRRRRQAAGDSEHGDPDAARVSSTERKLVRTGEGGITTNQYYTRAPHKHRFRPMLPIRALRDPASADPLLCPVLKTCRILFDRSVWTWSFTLLEIHSALACCISHAERTTGREGAKAGGVLGGIKSLRAYRA
jgi:hypothetical protein